MKKNTIGIAFKIITLVLFVVALTVIATSTIAYFLNKSAIENTYSETITTIRSFKAEKITDFFQRVKENIEFTSQLSAIRNRITEYKTDTGQVNKNTPVIDSALIQRPVLPQDTLPRLDTLRNTLRADTVSRQNPVEEFRKKFENTFLSQGEDLDQLFQETLIHFDILNVYITDRNGDIVFLEGMRKGETKKGINFDIVDQDGNTINVGRDSVYFSNVFPLRIKDEFTVSNLGRDLLYYMYVSAPVKDEQGDLLGVLIYEIDLDYIYKVVGDTTGLGRSGEIILTKDFGTSIQFINPSRSESIETFERNLPQVKDRAQAPQEAAQGLSGFGYTLNRNKKSVLSAWQPIPVIGWGLTVQIDREEVFQPIYNLMWSLITLSAVVLLISLVFGYIFSLSLVRPIIRLREIILLLSQGILPEKTRRYTRDETGEMTLRLNGLVDNLRKMASFARRIGHGEFKADFKPLSEQDALGNALISMRDSIQQSALRDDERNWIVTGMAEIGDILPSITTIDGLGELVTEYVTNKIGAVQGAFYTVNDENKDAVFIEMNASFAYNKRKYMKARFKFAEGLVGQAAIEQDTIIRTEIPDDYLTISSGILGDRKPKCILIRPLITNETVYGVLEFAGFERFGSREVTFVEEISEIIARTVFNIKVKENTEKLLRESQKMSSELQLQQEVLRQNAEEMEATQEELQRTNRELEKKIREVQRATDRTQLLLENASEVITIYESDATIRYISPSVEKILGYTQEEMIGIRDIVYVHPDGVDKYEQMFRDLIEEPDQRVTIEFSYQTKSAERIWLEATGINLLADPAIQGIVLNTRDITERRAAEREQRLRGQMQALSENSPDLITRISREGTVFYINPTIETYTGRNKDNYLQKHIRELELSEEIVNSWNDIIKDVITKNQKINIDMDFPSIMGERIMQVNAIPEYTDQQSLESVLVVSHDITERKIIEMEISQKNRKITESINYAKRIQEAILPDTNYIRQFLKDSFILYKPRDVVSGDFPWFFQKDDDIYIAAVDCTGHGVPGALISLIGFFLLNNIVNNEEANNPGIMLDLLDAEVTKTLKQDETDASTKDGMDISLCKINQRKQQIEYAGAHRPLYYLSEQELHEIKGNKYPIGGAQHKNRGRFTNTVINYRDSDCIYLFSDGFPDQFGGPKNKKFSPRRIRDILKNNHDIPLSDLNQVLLTEFESWRGNNKQTDDVLMIGIKL